MNWTEILITIPVDLVDLASDICTMVVPYGFYIEDYSELEKDALEIAHIDLIDEELIAKQRDNAIIHIYIDPENNPKEAIDYLEYRFRSEGVEYKIDTTGISEEDWANNWKKYFKPTEIGKKLLILPEWETAPVTDRKILKIDPGAAFGTGTHPTTKLCLSVIQDAIEGGETVLDIGTGSGILSIASLLLGAKSCFGVDIDPLAVKTAKENGAKNDFYEPEYTMVAGDLADKVSGRYDICIANIVADVIIRLCDNITDYIKPNGLFITSGIIDTRAQEVRETIEKTGFDIVEVYEEKGWVCMISKLRG